ncbi:unnamed protein product [Plutella xylostella]|uniref:Sphingomyelin phosphodiesterase n=1 Tax=Plutella xylostella TaxID=51655 RepID=A0A8S4G0Q4_PLUXY|nr:unnamed protein product [Plutella xylostella]
MKELLYLFTVLACVCAERLVSEDEVKTLFKKIVSNNITAVERQTLDDVFDLVDVRSLDSRAPRDLETRNDLECLICRSAFSTLFELVADGSSDEQLVDSITILCTALGIASNHICRGAVALNMPVLTHIIKMTPEARPQTFCSLVLQNIESNRNCRLDDERFEYQVTIPPKDADVLPPTPQSKPLKIAVLTDAHIDPYYEPYGVADCGEPTCCRKGQTVRTNVVYKQKPRALQLNGRTVERDGKTLVNLDSVESVRKAKQGNMQRYEPVRNPPPAGYWGDYRDCDTPLWAFDNVIDEITANNKDIDLVYYIGDSIDHHVWETTYAMITDVNRHVIDKMRASFGDDVPILPAIGNHESQPTNQFAPSIITEPKINTTWLYKSLADKYSHYLPKEAQEQFTQNGCYSVLVKPGFRVITINNNVAYKYNWWLVYDPLDAKAQLDWLVSSLLSAERDGERVHILAHIPPGVSDLTSVWTREYNRIVNRFASTIVGEFNGHTHSDEFKIFYGEDDTATAVAWGGGSATTYSKYNLNYKIVKLDRDTYHLNSMVNYIYNLTEANLTPNRPPHWFQLYDMKQAFNLPDLTAKSLDNLVHRMVTNQKSLLDLYAAFFTKISDERWPHDNAQWKLNDLCKTVVTVLWDRRRCQQLRDLFFS